MPCNAKLQNNFNIRIHYFRLKNFIGLIIDDEKAFYCFFYDLLLFNPLKSNFKWYRIEIPMVQVDTKTQIAFFKLCDRSPTPSLGGGNDENSYFFKNGSVTLL